MSYDFQLIHQTARQPCVVNERQVIFVRVNKSRNGRLGLRLNGLACSHRLSQRKRGWLLLFRKRELGDCLYALCERRAVNGAETELIGELFPTGGTLFHLFPHKQLQEKARDFIEAAILKSSFGGVGFSTRKNVRRQANPDQIILLLALDQAQLGHSHLS